MYEVKKFINGRLEKIDISAELAQRIQEHGIADQASLLKLAGPEIATALRLLAPGLLIDFLMKNPEILDSRALAAWSRNRGNI